MREDEQVEGAGRREAWAAWMEGGAQTWATALSRSRENSN